MMMMMLLLIIIIIWAPPRAQSPACRRVGRRRRPPLKLLPVPNERERKPERITEEAGSAGTSSAPALAVCSLRPPLPQPRAAHQGSRPLPEGLQIFFFLSTTSPTQGGENPGVPYPPPPPPMAVVCCGPRPSERGRVVFQRDCRGRFRARPSQPSARTWGGQKWR